MTERNKKSKRLQFKARGIVAVAVLIILAGCGGILGPDSPNQTSTSSPTSDTPSPTSVSTTVSTPTSTPEATATETPSYSTAYKQEIFTSNYTNSLKENQVNVTNTTVDNQNGTLALIYEMDDPTNETSTGWERENITLMYTAMIEVYYDRGYDNSWIPKQVNVTAVTPEGVRYERAYTTFERAKEMIDGEITAKRYLLEYYGTIEPGPANPEYEG